MLVAFLGNFSAAFVPAVQRHLSMPCELMAGDEAAIADRLREVDVLVTLALTGAMAKAATRLRLVQVPGAGTDGIPVEALSKGTLLANAYGHETAIAEYVLGAMIALTRDFLLLDAALRRGEWPGHWVPGGDGKLAVWPEMAGNTVGILGYGRIGREVARRARAFNMGICAIRGRAGSEAVSDDGLIGGQNMLEEVLRRSDYVVVAMPATPATIGSIGAPQLALMRPGAFLINVARGAIVDETALYDALAARRIAGAALDVWYQYPRDTDPALPARLPFHDLPNVLMTPHISGATEGMLDARARVIAENIRRVAQGKVPLNLVPR
jgi:phosphoglycerate dehydrogenase-like enzyme